MIETLKAISIKVMKHAADEYTKIWSMRGPFTRTEENDDRITLQDRNGEQMSIPRPPLEEWTPKEGYGKALVALLRDPGMHGSAMWVCNSGKIGVFVSYFLSDCSGNLTELGKEVGCALSNCAVS